MKEAVFTLFVIIVLSGCSFNPAVVADRPQPPSIRITDHKVNVGETLYSIAWRYDLNVNDLARSNRLDQPYIINPGQILTLKIDPSKIAYPLPSRYVVKSGDTLFSVASKYGLEVNSLARQNNLPPPYIIRSGQTLTLSRIKGPSKNESSKSLKRRAKVSRQAVSDFPNTKNKAKTGPGYSKNWEWKWPLKGSIIEGFNPNQLQKGLKIKSIENARVSPAAPGNVVYAGSGLRGYGKLIIIKHNDVFLSAYANNDRLLVDVGQSVTQADTISTLGVDGEMYFEIRKDGNPVNPKSYLDPS